MIMTVKCRLQARDIMLPTRLIKMDVPIALQVMTVSSNVHLPYPRP